MQLRQCSSNEVASSDCQQQQQQQQRKRRKAEVQLSSLVRQQQQLKLQAPLNNNRQTAPSAAKSHASAASLSLAGVRLIRNNLGSSGHQQQHHHYQLQHHPTFASGHPLVLTAAAAQRQPPATATAAVRLDLTSCGAGAVRAEVAFSGALEPATSATAAAAAANAGRLTAGQHQHQHQHQAHFVQVRNPLCVPRLSDYLSSWRTCMVPIVDLEHFAFMKPPCSKWRHLASRSCPGGGSAALLFTLMCYNILSDQYASPKSYWYCPDWALAWTFRRQGILENISAHMPSVVCLQEVETEQFYSFFLPHLSRRGYDGIFSPKSRAKTMDDKLRKRVDGCAIFWKRCEFRLVEEHVIEFSQQYLEHCWTQQPQQAHCWSSVKEEADDHQPSSQPQSPSFRGQASSEIFNRVTVRDNIALAVILSPVARANRGLGNSLMVCTSHIHWDPQFSDVKLIQTVVLTSALAAKIKQFKAASASSTLPLILCGDFNSLPNSGVIEFLNEGSVERDHPEFQRLGQDPSLDGLKLVGDGSQSSSFSHSLDLASCYSSVDLAFTNYTHEFKGIIDYIFASRRHFRVLNCLEGIADWFQSESVIGCPHPYVPSDHIPLAVQLEMLGSVS